MTLRHSVLLFATLFLTAASQVAAPRGIACPLFAAEAIPKEGLNVGDKMPFHIAEFVNGEDKNTSGCPSVMIANSRGRGVIVWCRRDSKAAFDLARHLDELETTSLRRFLVAFDADPETLEERCQSYRNLRAGRARQSSQIQLDQRGVEPTTQVLVFFLEGKLIQSKWTFGDADLNQDQIKKLCEAARNFHAETKKD